MDTLPKEIINEIKYFYQLPEIEITGGPETPYFQVKYLLSITRLKMIPHKKYDSSKQGQIYVANYDILDEFINDLSNNINCSYNEDYFSYQNDDNYIERFFICYQDDTIKIHNEVGEIFLTIESKNRVIEVLKKYRELLENVGEYYYGY